MLYENVACASVKRYCNYDQLKVLSRGQCAAAVSGKIRAWRDDDRENVIAVYFVGYEMSPCRPGYRRQPRKLSAG